MSYFNPLFVWGDLVSESCQTRMCIVTYHAKQMHIQMCSTSCKERKRNVKEGNVWSSSTYHLYDRGEQEMFTYRSYIQEWQ